MTKNSYQQDEQMDYEFVKNYTFFTGGHLDFYRFFVIFTQCLTIDKKITINDPNVIAKLFLEILATSPEAASWVSKRFEKSISKEYYHTYPNGELMLIYISGVTHHIHQFIWELGHHILNVEPIENERYFAYWLTSKDVFTHAFLDKLFSEIREEIKAVDKSGSLKAELQNMHLTKDLEFSVTENLLGKDGVSGIAIERVSKAITDGYFLEAITLQESIISDRLALFLYHQGDKAGSKTLYKLVRTVQTHHQNKLFENVDLWREKRNKAVHGLVRSSPYEKQIGILSFDNLAEETAKEGKRLVDDIISWFDEYVYDELSIFQITPYDVYRGNQEILSS